MGVGEFEMKKKQGIILSYRSLSKLIHPDQVRIIKMLGNNKKLNITQIQNRLKNSSIETYRHLKKLEGADLIVRKKKVKTIGSPVMISLKNKK